MSHDDREGVGSAPSLTIRLLTLPVRLCGSLSALLVLGMAGLTLYAILQRYFLQTPLKWGDEMLGYLVVAFVMLGTAEALRRGDHISIDLVTNRLRGRARRFQRLASALAVIGFALVLLTSTWESITFAHSFGSYSPGYLEAPMWIPQIPMALGAGLLILAAVARGLEALKMRGNA